MNVTPTAGIAAPWSAAKPGPAPQVARPLADDPKRAEGAPVEEKKGPPAPDGQGTRVDKRV